MGVNSKSGSAADSAGSSHEHNSHNEMYYVKIWAWLLLLLIISIIGPEIGIKWLTLITAFGIALVKAYIVAAKFMHLDIEKKYIHYMLYTMLLFVFLFYAGVAADIMKSHGHNWINMSSQQLIEQNKDYQLQIKH